MIESLSEYVLGPNGNGRDVDEPGDQLSSFLRVCFLRTLERSERKRDRDALRILRGTRTWPSDS